MLLLCHFVASLIGNGSRRLANKKMRQKQRTAELRGVKCEEETRCGRRVDE